MSIIDDLKQKWFIDVQNTLEQFPPKRRHSQSKQVAPYTDGNIVIPLIDGDRYMGMIRRAINELPSYSDLWFAGWELDNVATLGATDTSSQNRAWDLIEDAHNRHITVCGLVSQHLGLSHNTNMLSVTHFRLRRIGHILFDSRFPVPLGSHHQKLLCLRNAQNAEHSRVFLGSLDLTRVRWDRSLHLPIDDDRECIGV